MKIKTITIMFLTTFFVGCSSLPPLDFMVENIDQSKNRMDAELKSLTVGFVPATQQGINDCLNPAVPGIFKEAIQDALNRSLIFKDDAAIKVNVSAKIVTCDLPAAGIAMRTSLATRYEITNRSTGDIIFNKVISSQAVVEFGFSAIGLVRMQESTNRAFRNNIGLLLLELEDMSFSLNE